MQASTPACALVWLALAEQQTSTHLRPQRQGPGAFLGALSASSSGRRYCKLVVVRSSSFWDSFSTVRREKLPLDA